VVHVFLCPTLPSGGQDHMVRPLLLGNRQHRIGMKKYVCSVLVARVVQHHPVHVYVLLVYMCVA